MSSAFSCGEIKRQRLDGRGRCLLAVDFSHLDKARRMDCQEQHRDRFRSRQLGPSLDEVPEFLVQPLGRNLRSRRYPMRRIELRESEWAVPSYSINYAKARYFRRDLSGKNKRRSSTLADVSARIKSPSSTPCASRMCFRAQDDGCRVR